MEHFRDLEIVGLVSKVVSELQNHLGVADKTLAEFVIAQRLDSDTFETFKRKMTKLSGDSPPPSLLESIDRLVRLMHPSMKAKTTATPDEPHKQPVAEKAHVNPGSTRAVEFPVLDFIDGGSTQFETPELRAQINTPGPLTRKRHAESGAFDRDEFGPGPDDGNVPGAPPTRGAQRRRRDDKKDDIWHGEGAVPVLYRIYKGHVTGVEPFGVFVDLRLAIGRRTGLVDVSQLPSGRNDPVTPVGLRQSVKVKVISIDGSRIGLSMKDVDQDTGRDLAHRGGFGSGANAQPLGRGREPHQGAGLSGLDTTTGQIRRLTSPERWEARQLTASGVAKASDFPGLDDGPSLKSSDKTSLEEDLDVEVRDEEPPFLVGQTSQSLELSPIRIVKAPGGSMDRAAASAAIAAKERAEARQQQAQAVADAVVQEAGNADADQHRFAHGGSTAVAQALRQQIDQTPGKRTDMTMKQQRESLPIFAFRDQLLGAVEEYQVLVVVGETGSGKTTQLTQYLAEAGFATSGMIGCTQPRRVAATTVAKRVAEEVGCALGEEVGYSVRFDDKTGPSTRIKFMTDGTLQREILLDPDLKKYAVIMLDEAHERTIATDVLFALLKRTLKKRPDLKVIATSATLDAEKFSSYFNDAPIFAIPGRTFPVEIMYSREPESDYLDAALTTVMEIHLGELAGDILLFLTGQEEIDTSCEILAERIKALGPGVPELSILPMYAALPPEMQSRIFDPAPPGGRKVVIATNIAETSITIGNIHYVVDPGFAKQDAYDAKLGMDSLVVTPISQAQANQRAGRAGRTGPGKCFRLYTESAYQSEMLPSPVPAIQRQNVSSTILMLKAMGINDILHFDFMDPPSVNTTLAALEELYALGALDDEGMLTRLGRRIADFPLDSALAKVLIVASELGCADEILSIVAMLDLPNVFYRPREKEKQALADRKKAQFHDSSGDHLTLLNVYNAWKGSGFARAWCYEHFVLARAMQQARDVRDQLVGIMQRYRLPVVSCGDDTERVRRALCAGFFRNAARRDRTEAGTGPGCYKTVVQGTQVYLHPSSALSSAGGKQTAPAAAEWVVYHSLVLTSREYMHWVTSVDPRWLVEAAPTFFWLAGGAGERMSKRRREERIEPLQEKGKGKDEWRMSARRRGGGRGGRATWG